MIASSNLNIAILAGGKSSRMGEEKGLVVFKGKSLIQYALDMAKSLQLKSFIISSNAEYSNFTINLIEDVWQECGPAGGIHAGLSSIECKYIMFIPCDCPLISVELLQFLIESHQEGRVSVLKAGGRIHHIIGIFEKGMENDLVDCIEEGTLKMETINNSIGINVVDADEKFGLAKAGSWVTNFNSKTDILNYESGM